MRSQLLASGLLVILLGVAFYVSYLPFVFYWSVPFVIGGIVMVLAGYLAPESSGPVQPPEGFRFCRYCSAQIPVASERCPHCNGVQAKEGS